MDKRSSHQLQERRVWLGFLTHCVKPGTIVEFGCGSGFVLEVLAMNFTDSIIIGIDKSLERLEQVIRKRLNNIVTVNADITKKIFLNETLDTCIFVGVLHEIFSTFGKRQVETTMRLAGHCVKHNGVLIIQDFLKPVSQQVKMTFINKDTQRRFTRFAHEFYPRKIHYREHKNSVKLDIADAVEFISKYRSPTEEDWQEEMEETHFFFTEDDFKKIAQQDDFFISEMQKLPSNSERWVEVKQDIEFEFEHDYHWIQLVLIKR